VNHPNPNSDRDRQAGDPVLGTCLVIRTTALTKKPLKINKPRLPDHLCTKSRVPFMGADWIFEQKLDGF
jgi:hypothetical protein